MLPRAALRSSTGRWSGSTRLYCAASHATSSIWVADLVFIPHACADWDTPAMALIIHQPPSSMPSKLPNREHLTCNYTCQDIRQAGFPQGMGLVMLIYGEFNVFQTNGCSPYPEQGMGCARAGWYSSPGASPIHCDSGNG